MHDRQSTAGRTATWRRAVDLYRAFRVEQSDPDRFYSLLAADSVRQVALYAPVRGRSVLDVGGGPGYFAAAFAEAGACYLAVDANVGELSGRGKPGPRTVVADGMRLPVRTESVDIAYSSNVLEHVVQPWGVAEEMIRATRPGGTVFLSFTTWLSPWGGHETSPWHYLGGRRAADRYARRHGRRPKNDFGRSLFPVSAGEALAWARSHDRVRLVAAFPRYHPWWTHWIVRLPGVREVAVWNLALVLSRR